MGIKSAHEVFATSMKPGAHLQDYAGMTALVDATGWVHKAVHGSRNVTQVVTYVMEKVALLRRYNVTPFLVFYGGKLPMKAAVQAIRR